MPVGKHGDLDLTERIMVDQFVLQKKPNILFQQLRTPPACDLKLCDFGLAPSYPPSSGIQTQE